MSGRTNYQRPRLKNKDLYRKEYWHKYKPLPINLEAALDPKLVASVKKRRLEARRAAEDYEEAKRLKENDLL